MAERPILLWCLALAACAGEGREIQDARAAPDADVDRHDAGAIDLGVDAAPLDQGVSGSWAAIALASGEQVEGELVATYDHRSWWNDPSELETFALFDQVRFGPVREDRSFRFVSSSEIRSMSLGAAPEGRVSFRDFARGRRFVLERPPHDGVSMVITGNEDYHLQENGFGDFAFDIVKTDESGVRFHGSGLQNSDYLVWDEPVFLPHGGEVVEVVRDAPDNAPGTPRQDAINNLVGVHLGGAYYLYLLHFAQGSIPETIAPGVVLATGDYLGRTGNSGVSREPHVHLTILWYDGGGTPPRSWSVPGEIAEIYTSTAPRGGMLQRFAKPRRRNWISSAPF
jgi:hypothetical protein